MRVAKASEQFFRLAFPQFGKLVAFVRAAKNHANGGAMGLRLSYKVAIGSGIVFFFILIFGWAVFPKFLHSKIKSACNVKEGSDMREMYLKVPFPLVFKLYIFNITNPAEVAETGAIPIVNEIGPYVYDEWKEKINIVDDDQEDTMVYNIKNTFIFNKKLSGSLTGDEIITIPHPLIAGIIMAVAREKPSALSLINKAINSIYGNPTHPFITTTMNELFFTGVLIYCNVTDFAGKAVCTQLKTEAKDLEEVEPMIFKFSIFGPKNGTAAQKLKVLRGYKNAHDLGRLLEFEGQTQLDIWTTDECNTFQGTDSTIFPPFLKKEEGIASFAPDLCRSLVAYYVTDTKYAGFPVRQYAADFGDQTNNEADKCYCATPDSCLKKGVFDLMKCVGAPMLASLPHFYLGDPSYQNSVKGLNPNKEDHEIIILFESMTGSPVSARKRLQFSLPVHNFSKVNCMKNMPDVVIPLFWVEEGVDLNKTWTSQLNNQLFRVLKITKIVKYLILVGSLAGMAFALYLHITKTAEVTITPLAKNGEKNNDLITVIGRNREEHGHDNHAMGNDVNDKY